MSFVRPTHYRLTPKALTDLDDIWRYTAEIWSISQADNYVDDLAHIFEVIVGMPEVARERLEFTPPVRIHAHNRHLIIYVIIDDHIAILRLLGGRQDWQAALSAIEP